MKRFVVFALSAKSHVPRVLPVVCVSVVCSAIVSRIKDLQQWESVFFSDLWLQKPLYKEWLREVKGDKHKARCIVCMKDVDISSMGESAHTSYMNSCLSLDFAVRGVLEKWKMCH